MDKNNKNLQQNNYNEIDLIQLLSQIWSGRWVIIVTTAVFFVLAIIYLLYMTYSGTKEYESQATLITESPSPDSLINVLKSPLFLSTVLETKLAGLTPGPPLTVNQVLERFAIPPQGNIAGITNRINGIKGAPGILVVTVMMQDQYAATQLADSIGKKIIQFLRETQIKKIITDQKILADDTTTSFQIIRETASINLKYLSKGTSNNIQYLMEGTKKEIQFLSKGSEKNIQFQIEESAKNIQFLTEGFLKAESIYLKSQQTLADYYVMKLKNSSSIDSLEVKKLNSDIKLKYDVYSCLYLQLEQAKIEANKQFEQRKLEADKQLEQAKIKMYNQQEQANLDADKQVEQSKIEAEKQIQQAKLDAEIKIDKVAQDTERRLPRINQLEPSTHAIQLNPPKTKRVVVMTVFLGFIIGIGIVFGKKAYDKSILQNKG